MLLEELLQNKKLIVVCGSGGVGKTTVSASLALMGALMGKKTIVLTIDPAKRLATSLGLKEIGFVAKKIDPTLLERLTTRPGAELYAMMLDPKNTFDMLVTKHAPSKEAAENILKNKLYQHMSSMIAGSQEYMAMEKLNDIIGEDKYDLIILDTPPTVHAVDFLEAPNRMIAMIEHSLLKIFLKPALFVGKSGFKLFQRGSSVALKVLDKITGFDFLRDLSEMLTAFKDLLDGFKERAEQIKKILSQDSTAFIMVAVSESKSLAELGYLASKLKKLDLDLEGLVLNRIYPLYSKSPSEREKDTKLLADEVGSEAAQKMVDTYLDFLSLAKRDDEFKSEVQKILDKKAKVCAIPLFETDIHELEGLYRLGSYLTSPP